MNKTESCDSDCFLIDHYGNEHIDNVTDNRQQMIDMIEEYGDGFPFEYQGNLINNEDMFIRDGQTSTTKHTNFKVTLFFIVFLLLLSESEYISVYDWFIYSFFLMKKGIQPLEIDKYSIKKFNQ